ncbi:MAG: ATP-dependent Clp protease ATP-binding subunit, partial [Fimbriimonadales bacterium]|nr:ATP-dependent Clp protease ATP-binding subunit [Fimbriimonadales bacterium]
TNFSGEYNMPMERALLPDDKLTEEAQQLAERAVDLAGGKPPDARHLLLALLKAFPQIVSELLPQIDLSRLEQILQGELQNPNSPIAIPYEAVIELALRIAEREQQPQADAGHILKAIALLTGLIPRESVFPEPPLIAQIGLNLTEQARQGAIPQVVGREKEIDLLIETLCRPINPYAVLVGLEGVGRRAVVQGVAQRIADGKVPEPLRDRPVIMLPQMFDHPAVMGRLVEEATQRRAILYLEPFEMFLSAPAPQIEAMRMEFLSALVARRVPVIGAMSSLQGLRRHISRAPDLLKRFQPLEVHPMSADETLIVLRQLASLFQEQHAVEFPPETLQLIVEVAGEHILHRPYPDKAILLMDHVAGRARAQGLTRVEPRLVWETAGVVTGLPIGKGELSMLEALRDLEAFLKSRVIGQDEAIETLVRVFSLKIRRLDLRPERPNGVFLFAGPTGVGKTETARALAEYFFGSRDRILRLDMNQFYEAHTAARLLGAEFGYVGFEMGSPLLDFVAENPFCVVLLDEMEKAHREIHKLFLQIFDDGYIIDAQGRRVSFADSVIIMTSNLQPEKAVGFLRERPTLEDWRKAFVDYFAPEFINRVDAICVFQPLSRETVRQIVRDRLLRQILEVYRKRNIELSVSEEAIEWLVEKGYSEHYGARELERIVERSLLLLLTPHVPAMIDSIGGAPQRFEVVVSNQQLALRGLSSS